MNAARMICLMFLFATPCSISQAQAVAYHHRSTAEGDAASGWADYVRASGAASRDWAEGYDRYMDGEGQRLELEYRLYEIRREVAQNRREQRERKANDRRRRFAEQASQFDADARRLALDAAAGMYFWPEALRGEEFSQSMHVVEDILTRLGQGSDAALRIALATETSVLRKRVASATAIPYADRLKAVGVLKLVQRVATLDTTSSVEVLAMAPQG